MAALAVVALAACRGGGEPDIKLDGTPRHPDDQGVATAISREEITLDGARSYKLSPRLRSFSTFTLETTSVFTRKGQYVQIGLDGKTVEWLAGFAAVIPDPPRVFYVGRLEEVNGRELVFADGTVLDALASVEIPAPGRRVQVEIDPDRHAVRKVTEA